MAGVGGKASKRKGDNFERDIIHLFGGRRTFWQPEDKEKRGDVVDVPYLGRGECKARKDGFKQIYEWLGDNDFLAIRADRKKALIVIRTEDLQRLIDEMDGLKKNSILLESAKR